MLVLTRKQQERIVVGDGVVVTVVRIKGNAVRIGIEAPDDVRIVRGEIAGDETRSAKAPAESTKPAIAHTAAPALDDDSPDLASWVERRANRRRKLDATAAHAI